MLTGTTPRLHVLRGQLHYANGNVEKAKEELATALSLDGHTREAHYYLGLVHSQKQMFENAAQEFEAELTGNPNHVEAKYRLAQNLLARGTMRLPDAQGLFKVCNRVCSIAFVEGNSCRGIV